MSGGQFTLVITEFSDGQLQINMRGWFASADSPGAGLADYIKSMIGDVANEVDKLALAHARTAGGVQ